MAFPLVFGVDTFGDLAFGANGIPLSQAETIRRVVDEGVLAEEVGLDFFGIGEHHTNDWPMPAGDVVLAAIASYLHYSPWISGARTQLRRPGESLPALLDPACDLRRAGRGDSRSRLEH